MSTTKHTAEPFPKIIKGRTGWNDQNGIPQFVVVPVVHAQSPAGRAGFTEEQADHVIACVNACAKFPDPAAALTDLRLLIGQARGLIDEGALSQADNMLLAALGVLDGEEG